MSVVRWPLWINSRTGALMRVSRFRSGWLRGVGGRTSWGERRQDRGSAGVKEGWLEATDADRAEANFPWVFTTTTGNSYSHLQSREEELGTQAWTGSQWQTFLQLGPPTPFLSRFIFHRGKKKLHSCLRKLVLSALTDKPYYAKLSAYTEEKCSVTQALINGFHPDAAVLGFCPLIRHFSSVSNTSLWIHYRKASTPICFVEKH